MNEDQKWTKRHRRTSNSFFWGFILVTLGLIFLLQNIGVLGRHVNWWAIFIFIPAFGSFAGAWAALQHSDGRFNTAVRSALGSGLIITTVAVMFLFGMDWGLWWPLMLIMPGLSLILNSFPDTTSKLGPSLTGLLGFGVWSGASVTLLGVTFLLSNLKVINLHLLFGSFQWWGIFILIPGIGALLNAFMIFQQNDGHLNIASRALLGLGLIICAVAALALFGLDWSLLAPIILIAAGIALLAGFIGRR